MNNCAIINPETPYEIVEGLKKLDLEPLKIPLCSRIEKPVAGHPDMQLFIHGEKLFCRDGLPSSLLKKLEKHKEIIICSDELKMDYPYDIKFNIAATGKEAFHKFKFTSEKIKDYFIKKNVTL